MRRMRELIGVVIDPATMHLEIWTLPIKWI